MTNDQQARGAKPRRPRRIAADEAHAWARNLRLGNPYAKLVLSMLTLYVNGDGACFVGISALAEDCELAQETVRRRLAWLEEIGAITRFPQWLDENGRRNSEGRGRRSTDEIRLMISTDPDEIEARAKGEQNDDGGTESAPPDRPVSPLHGRGLNPHPGTVSPLLGLQRPSNCGGGLISEPEPEESPQAPPSGGMCAADDRKDEAEEAGGGEADPEGFVEFKAAYEGDGTPVMRVSLARQIFAALSDDERGLATTAARGLIAHRSREKRPGMKPSAQTFLREPDAWPAWAKLAPVETRSASPPVFVCEDSPHWKALCVLAAIRGEAQPVARLCGEHGRGTMISNPLPPSRLALATYFARTPDGDLDYGSWIIVEAGSRPCGAWKEFAQTDAQAITVRKERREILGKIHEAWPVKVQGLRVPCEWPPRKDGSVSTGPPNETAA